MHGCSLILELRFTLCLHIYIFSQLGFSVKSYKGKSYPVADRVFSHALAQLIIFLKGLLPVLMEKLVLIVDFNFLELLIIIYSIFKALAYFH